MFSTVFQVQFSTGYFDNTVQTVSLSYLANYLQSGLRPIRVLYRILLSEKHYFGVSVSGKVLIRAVQKYPASLTPICSYVKSSF